MDKEDIPGALLRDLPEAFDCLSHDLLVKNATKFLFDYLTNCTKKTKILQSYSFWEEILTGVSQGLSQKPPSRSVLSNFIEITLLKSHFGMGVFL